MRPIIFLSLLLGLFVAIGCGQPGPPGPPVVPISGKVTLEGQPLTDAYLYFKTVETGALEQFPIINGEFNGKTQVGSRRVEIIANRPQTKVIDGKEVQVPENILDPSFGTESTLTAEVTLDGPNQFAFEVRRK